MFCECPLIQLPENIGRHGLNQSLARIAGYCNALRRVTVDSEAIAHSPSVCVVHSDSWHQL